MQLQDSYICLKGTHNQGHPGREGVVEHAKLELQY